MSTLSYLLDIYVSIFFYGVFRRLVSPGMTVKLLAFCLAIVMHFDINAIRLISSAMHFDDVVMHLQ